MNQPIQYLDELFQQQLEASTTPDGNIRIAGVEIAPAVVLQREAGAYEEAFRDWLGSTWLPDREARLEEILELHGNRGRFEEACKLAKCDQLVPLVGSGMSYPSGLPMWAGLLRRVRTYSTVDEAALDALLATGSFEEAVDNLCATMSRRLFDERIERELSLAGDAPVAGPVRLLPHVFPTLALTTNLDDVLERAYRTSGRPFQEVLGGPGIARYRQRRGSHQPLLLKLHGDRASPAERVLNTEEYEQAYAPGRPVRTELELIYRTQRLLCLGASLGDDRTVRLIGEVAAKDRDMPRHFAFLNAPADTPTRVARENFLTAHGIFPIWYDGGHDEALETLLVGLLRYLERL